MNAVVEDLRFEGKLLGRLELLAEIEDRLDMLFDDVDMNRANTIDGIIEIAEHSRATLETEAG